MSKTITHTPDSIRGLIMGSRTKCGMCGLVIACVLLALTFSAQAFQFETRLQNPKQEIRAEKLFREIRCVVCEGESLAESNADLAVDMRALIRGKISRGETDKDIKKFLVERYGIGILQKPPFEPDTYLLWLTPVILLLGGLAIILWRVRIRKYFHKKEKLNG